MNAPKARSPRFSKKTLEFLRKASRQKRPEWLDRHRAEYEEALLAPLTHLAEQLKERLGPLAPGYHFPQRGIGRIKRSAERAREEGRAFKGWVHYSAARPRKSRFETNPNLYFMIDGGDSEHPVLSAGGLYMPSSAQVRAIREAIARDASAFDRLFASKEFRRAFPDGFCDDKISSRPARGYDREHPRMDWLRLQAFFVWRPYTMREFTSADFPQKVAADLKQVLRLNALLELAIEGKWRAAEPKGPKTEKLEDRLGDLEAPRREMDF